MNRILDKSLIFTLCMIIYLSNPHSMILVVPVILAVALGAFLSFYERRGVTLSLFAVCCAACVFYPDLLFFLPLVCYDVFVSGPGWAVLPAAFPVIANLSKHSPYTSAMVVMIALVAFLAQRRTGSLEKLQAEYVSLRDSTREFALRLESKNRELLERQDYEVSLATLNERNRIAREIHDSVGHLLTSAILQIGAMLITCRDEKLKESLVTLKETLAQGMDSIRSSIHNLYEESVDLQAEVQKLLNGFTFCPVSLTYSVNGNPRKDVKYTMIAVLKEALSNVVRHSNATRVTVTLREHPGFYQLIVKDNGTERDRREGSGIGLSNIRSRVENLRGNVNISSDDGFLLFISIPKEDAE